MSDSDSPISFVVSVAVPSNIAEGYGRNTTGKYKQFLGIARGSNLEIQTQLLISRELGFGDANLWRIADDLSQEVAKILVGLMCDLK